MSTTLKDEKNIRQRNQFIAEFIGLYCEKKRYMLDFQSTYIVYNKQGEKLATGNSEAKAWDKLFKNTQMFHNDYNWVMSLVENAERMGAEVIIVDKSVTVKDNSFNYTCVISDKESKLTAIYDSMYTWMFNYKTHFRLKF